MKFVAITEEEFAKKERRHYKKVQALIEEFVNMNTKVVRVDLNERDYANPKSAHGSFSHAAKASGFPVKVRMIDKELYLIRKDI